MCCRSPIPTASASDRAARSSAASNRPRAHSDQAALPSWPSSHHVQSAACAIAALSRNRSQERSKSPSRNAFSPRKANTCPSPSGISRSRNSSRASSNSGQAASAPPPHHHVRGGPESYVGGMIVLSTGREEREALAITRLGMLGLAEDVEGAGTREQGLGTQSRLGVGRQLEQVVRAASHPPPGHARPSTTPGQRRARGQATDLAVRPSPEQLARCRSPARRDRSSTGRSRRCRGYLLDWRAR